MKALKIKTIKTQVSTSGGEGKYRILQTLLKNTSISTKSITFGPILMSKDWIRYRKSFQQLGKLSSKTQIQNRCLRTNRARSINQTLRVSRQETRRLLLNGNIPGATRSTW